MCLNKIQADWKQFLRPKWMTFLAVAVSKCLADSPLTTIFHFHAPLYFPVPARSRSRSNKIPQEKLFLWYFRSYWMQHQQEISWERLFLRSFQAPVGNPSGLVEENSKKNFGEWKSFSWPHLTLSSLLAKRESLVINADHRDDSSLRSARTNPNMRFHCSPEKPSQHVQ